MRLRPWAIGAILMTAVLVNASDYSFLVPLREARVEAHRDVVSHAAPAPDRYRLLVPHAADIAIRALATVMPYDKAVGRVYAVFHFVALAALLAMLAFELSLWFTTEQAVVGALLVGSTIRIALRQGEYLDLSSIPLTSVFAPHSLLEPIFVAAAVVLSLQQRRWLMVALIGIATLNSEAAVLLPFLYLAVNGISTSSLRMTAGYAGCWLVVSFGIRLIVGPSDPTMTADQLWRENVAHLPTTMINLVLFVGPLWVLAAIGIKHAPDPMRRAAWLIPLYLGVVAIRSLWWDVRVLMGLYPLLMPLILSAVFTHRTGGDKPLGTRGDQPSGLSTSARLDVAAAGRVGSVT